MPAGDHRATPEGKRNFSIHRRRARERAIVERALSTSNGGACDGPELAVADGAPAWQAIEEVAGDTRPALLGA